MILICKCIIKKHEQNIVAYKKHKLTTLNKCFSWYIGYVGEKKMLFWLCASSGVTSDKDDKDNNNNQ